MFGSGMGAGGWGLKNDDNSSPPPYQEPVYQKKEYVPFWEEPKEKGPPPSHPKDTCTQCGVCGIRVNFCTNCGKKF